MQALQSDRVLRECVRTYERIAPVYDVLDAAYEWSWKGRLRAELFRHARGRILDVGVGSGCNLPHYPDGAEVVGIDASAAMLQRAGQRAEGLPFRASFAQMNLLDLGFADRTFDTVCRSSCSCQPCASCAASAAPAGRSCSSTIACRRTRPCACSCAA